MEINAKTITTKEELLNLIKEGVNPLEYIKEERDIDFVCHSLVIERTDEDLFWEDSAENLLRAILYYIVFTDNEEKTLARCKSIVEIGLNEADGKDYYFVTKEQFEEDIKKGNFLEYAKVHGDNYYGTPKRKVEESLASGKDIILEIDIQGALEVKEKMEESIFIFIMPPSMRELKDRLIKRNTESKDKIIERFKNAYKEINEVTKYNYIVINDEVQNAVDKVKAIILAEKCRVDRIEDFELNNEEELLHELLTL